MLTDAAAKVKQDRILSRVHVSRFKHLHVHVILISTDDFQAAYDKTCAAKKRAEERDRELDDRRKKFKMGELLLRR